MKIGSELRRLGSLDQRTGEPDGKSAEMDDLHFCNFKEGLRRVGAAVGMLCPRLWSSGFILQLSFD